MDIRIRGCHGSQMPGYNTTSFLLDNKILIDDGTITPLLTVEEQNNIHYILVTHAHLDRVKDMMFLVDNIYYLKKDHPLLIFIELPFRTT